MTPNNLTDLERETLAMFGDETEIKLGDHRPGNQLMLSDGRTVDLAAVQSLERKYLLTTWSRANGDVADRSIVKIDSAIHRRREAEAAEHGRQLMDWARELDERGA